MTRRHRRRSKRGERGFTLLEVMLALAIMLVALMGIVSLQRAAINANVDARSTTTATANNQRWASILRRRALSWTTSDVSGIQYLSTVGTGWVIPVGDDPFGIDWFGAPTTTADDIRFCTMIRLRYEHPDASMRADVVTFWGREGRGGVSGVARARTLCVAGSGGAAADSVLGAAGTPDPLLRHVRSTVTLRRIVP